MRIGKIMILLICIVGFSGAEQNILSEKEMNALKEWMDSPSFEKDVLSYEGWESNIEAAENFLKNSLKVVGYSIDVQIRSSDMEIERYIIYIHGGNVEDETYFIGYTCGVVGMIVSNAQWKSRHLILSVNERAWAIETQVLKQIFTKQMSGDSIDPALCVKSLKLLSDLSQSSEEKYSSETNIYRNKKYQFSIVFPENWIIGKGNKPHIVVRADSKLSGNERQHISIGVQLLPPETKLIDITDLNATDLINPKFTTLIASGYVYIADKKALWIKSRTATPKNHIVMYLAVILHNDYMYGINAGVFGNSPKQALDHFQNFEPLLFKVIETFRFEENTESEYQRGNPRLSLWWILILMVIVIVIFSVINKYKKKTKV
jgi:hypothetical protein